MAEPDWKRDLQDALWAWCRPEELEALTATVMPHIEAAYQRGLMAGRSQRGYDTRRKGKESAP